MKQADNFFFDKTKFLTIDVFRIYYAVLFLISFSLTELGRFVYRPYIYKNNIFDFGLADSIGNLGGIAVQIFFGLAVLNPDKKKGIRLIIFFSFGYILYEAAQLFLPKGVFDWYDIIGTLIGGVFSFLIYYLINTIIPNKVFKIL